LDEVAQIVREELNTNEDARIIVFTHFRDTSLMVLDTISQVPHARPVRFIGQNMKSDDKGLSQRQQAAIVDQFRNGQYNVLIATSVAEEGLDIPSTDLVVFYEPIPSEIRTIQRRGRTARKRPGKMIILITKGTADEGYFWAAKRREKTMHADLDLLRSKLDKQFSKASMFPQQEIKESQTTLQEYDAQSDKIRITVDHREYRSTVVQSLLKKGAVVHAEQLSVGDYIVSSRIGIERKQVDDFLNSLLKGTLFVQLKKLRDAYARPFLIIEGTGLFTKRNINHHAIYGTFVSIIVDFGISIITTENQEDTADLLFITSKREKKTKNKEVILRGGKSRLSTNETIQFILEGFPFVSSVIAQRLLHHFGSIRALVNASEEELQEVQGIGKKIAKSIYHMVNSEFSYK
jgi:Fanconi anemia group M protein